MAEIDEIIRSDLNRHRVPPPDQRVFEEIHRRIRRRQRVLVRRRAGLPVLVVGMTLLGVTLLMKAFEPSEVRPVRKPEVRERLSSPSPGTIAFAWHHHGNLGLFLIRKDETEIEQLTDGGVSPSWSPTGDRIAYARGGQDATHIWVIDLSSGDEFPLTSGNHDDGNPAWAPDGSTIAFTRIGRHGTQIHIVPSGGGRSRRVTKLEASVYEPAWLPDGRHLIVTVDPLEEYGDLYTIDLRGRLVERLTTGPADEYRPNLSPDGRRLAFYRVGRLRAPQIFVLDLRTGEERRVTMERGIGNGFAWSADGRQIVYVASGPDREDLFIVDAETGRSRLLWSGPGYPVTPSWSPVG